MEAIGVVASFIAIGQAIGTAPKIIKTLKEFANGRNEVAALIDELESLYIFYESVKENITLFSSEQSPSLLRADEPSYLKHVRGGLESLIAELQDLADLCLTDNGDTLKASKRQWLKRREKVTRLREECCQQRQRLERFYALFRDQILHKQGEILVRIHANTSQRNEHHPHDSSSLLSPEETRPSVSPGSAEVIVAKSDATSLDPSIGAGGRAGRRCRCFCHSLRPSRTSIHGQKFRMPGRGFVSYRFQTVTGNRCNMSCCTTSQSFVALQFHIPIWLHSLAMTGSFRYGFPFNLNISLAPAIRLGIDAVSTYLGRVCYLEDPRHFNRWLSHYGRSILSVDENGRSVIEMILEYEGYSKLTYCTNTWPRIIKETDGARHAAYDAWFILFDEERSTRLGLPTYLSTNDKFHLSKFIQFMEIEDVEDDIFEILRAMDSIEKLDQLLLSTPDIITKRHGRGDTILHGACTLDAVELVKRLLESKELLDMTNDEGYTPLHSAIEKYAWSSVELLIERGCQINTSNYRGMTPLLSVLARLTYGEVDAIHLANTLLERGADVGVENTFGKCVWHMLGPVKGHEEELWKLYETIFDAGGACLIDKIDKSGYSPLAEAILCQDPSLVSFLRELGAYPYVVGGGLNILHMVGWQGNEQSCHLAAELEISNIDIRTTNDSEFTPLCLLQYQLQVFFKLSSHFLGPESLVTWSNMTQDDPGKELVSREKSIAFEDLLQTIRDRMLTHVIDELNLIISKLQAQDLSSARDELRRLADGKEKAKIDYEAETFRAIELDIREGRLELAIESINEFIQVSRDRMQIKVSDEECNRWGPPPPCFRGEKVLPANASSFSAPTPRECCLEYGRWLQEGPKEE
ncbi:hypothetical protein F5Y10DRAFT_248659 [Nemania abortiva]|nr:hypothetical protein F5Y10DRAFT_248659 [Nemania abortiva]